MTAKAQRYRAGHDSDGKLFVSGGHSIECGYYGGTLSPDSRFESEKDCERAARIANIAFEEGRQHAKAEIRAALGLNI